MFTREISFDGSFICTAPRSAETLRIAEYINGYFPDCQQPEYGWFEWDADEWRPAMRKATFVCFDEPAACGYVVVDIYLYTSRIEINISPAVEQDDFDASPTADDEYWKAHQCAMALADAVSRQLTGEDCMTFYCALEHAHVRRALMDVGFTRIPLWNGMPALVSADRQSYIYDRGYGVMTYRMADKFYRSLAKAVMR